MAESIFSRYTESARQVVVEAQHEAKYLGHNYIGSEHLLLGILREGGFGAQALWGAGRANLDFSGALHTVEQAVPAEHGERTPGTLPLTPHAIKVCTLATQEADSLEHNYVGTRHQLLGLLLDAQPSDEPRQQTGLRIDIGTGVQAPESQIFPDDERSIVAEVLAKFTIDLAGTYEDLKEGLGSDEDDKGVIHRVAMGGYRRWSADLALERTKS